MIKFLYYVEAKSYKSIGCHRLVASSFNKLLRATCCNLMKLKAGKINNLQQVKSVCKERGWLCIALYSFLFLSGLCYRVW